MTEEELNDRDAHADRMVPHEQANSRQEIEPGEERAVIDGMKASIKDGWEKRSKLN